MASNSQKQPTAPDPATILGLENQYNHYNQSNPFGSSTWSQGPNGHETLTTSANPQTQAAIDRAFGDAATPYQKEYVPQGMDQLTQAILGKVAGNYGVKDVNTNMKPQGQGMSPPQGMSFGQQQGGDPMMAYQAKLSQQGGGGGNSGSSILDMMGGQQSGGPPMALLNHLRGAMPPPQMPPQMQYPTQQQAGSLQWLQPPQQQNPNYKMFGS